MSAPGLDAPVFVFWSEGEGILAGFGFKPAAREEEGALHVGVCAEAIVFKCEPGAPHPTPIYMPPVLVAEVLALLRVTVPGTWHAKETTRRELTAAAHRWAAADLAAQANRRRN